MDVLPATVQIPCNDWQVDKETRVRIRRGSMIQLPPARAVARANSIRWSTVFPEKGLQSTFNRLLLGKESIC